MAMGKAALYGGTPVRRGHSPEWPRATREDIDAVVEALESGSWCRIGGDRARRFEAEFAAYQGARFGVAVNSTGQRPSTDSHTICSSKPCRPKASLPARGTQEGVTSTRCSWTRRVGIRGPTTGSLPTGPSTTRPCHAQLQNTSAGTRRSGSPVPLCWRLAARGWNRSEKPSRRSVRIGTN